MQHGHYHGSGRRGLRGEPAASDALHNTLAQHVIEVLVVPGVEVDVAELRGRALVLLLGEAGGDAHAARRHHEAVGAVAVVRDGDLVAGLILYGHARGLIAFAGLGSDLDGRALGGPFGRHPDTAVLALFLDHGIGGNRAPAASRRLLFLESGLYADVFGGHCEARL